MPALARTIASLALVKFNWEHLQRDYLETFVPFVATLLERGQYDSVFDTDVHKLCEDFAATYGFQVPYHPMIAILNRARKRGLLTRSHGRFVPVHERLARRDLSEKAAEQEQRLDDLVNRFVAFAREKVGRVLTSEEANEGFIAF